MKKVDNPIVKLTRLTFQRIIGLISNIENTKMENCRYFFCCFLSIVLTTYQNNKKLPSLTLAGTTPTYYYYLKDHQGNNRVVINQSGAVQQVNHYYPFGGLFGEGVQTANQPYKYNGKELDRFQGVDMYDYGARHYDAALGRWFTVDPLAEK